MEKVSFRDPETNEEVFFVVEEETQVNGIQYLLVSDADAPEDAEDVNAYILKALHTQDEEVLYELVSDDVEFAAIAKVFAELTDEDTDVSF